MYNPDLNPFPPELAAPEQPPADDPVPMLDPGTFIRQLHKEKRDIADRKRQRNKKVKAFKRKRRRMRKG